MTGLTQQRLRSPTRPHAVLCGVIGCVLLWCGRNASAAQDTPLEDAIRKFAPAANAAAAPPRFPESIWEAIGQHHRGAIEEYLTRGVDLTRHHPIHGRTALSWAAVNGNDEALVQLFDHGIDPNARNRDGSTPLHDAALMGEAGTTALLLERGADPRLTTRRRETPLDTARLSWVRSGRRIRQLGLEIDRTELQRGRAEVVALLGGRDRRAVSRLGYGVAALAFILLTGVVILFHILTCCCLTWALYHVPVPHRQIGYWQIWLLAIPCVALVGNFHVIGRLSDSYSTAFGSQLPERAVQARQLGAWFSVLFLGTIIPLITAPCVAACVVLLGIYCLRLGQLRTLAGNRLSMTLAPAGRILAPRGPVPIANATDNAAFLPRRYDLDALRGFAMLLGIGLHSAMPFGVGPWFIQDPQQHDGFRWFFSAVHGFRMPLFFLLSGYFTSMLWKRRGLRAMVRQRFRRIALPLVVGTLVLVPVMNVTSLAALVGTTVASLRLEAEQQVATSMPESARDLPKTRPYVGRGLIDFDGLIATYGLIGFVLFYLPVFQHLWFLWFLCWLVGLFYVFAAVTEKWKWKAPPAWLISGPARYLWILPVTMLFQSVMVLQLPWFGPDTSTGILPAPHVLGYFAVFFGFGALYFCSDDQQGRLGNWWWLHLAIGLLVVLPYGMTRVDVPPAIGILLQALYTWSISFGMLGFFRKYFRRANPVVRYLSDASYWLYLTHVPLVVLCQWWVYTWQIPALIKFLTVVGCPTVVLLVIYHHVVRHTWIGTALNGPRVRGAKVSNAVG
ncbi:MAG: acyltransferase family protein [Planctomycetota bacterium]|nr:acyltransferase family protein [Planctomycetota bacterium]